MPNFKLTKRAEMLMNNDLNWYVVTDEDGNLTLEHRTSLSAILECGMSMKDYGIKGIEQCWNGEDLSTEDDWI